MREFRPDSETRLPARTKRDRRKGSDPLNSTLALILRGPDSVTLAAMALRLATYEGARIHNYRLGIETIHELEQELLRRTKAQRKGLPGLEPGREDVIVAGVLILRGVMEGLKFTDCLVSDLGLREGVLIDLARRITEQRCDG